MNTQHPSAVQSFWFWNHLHLESKIHYSWKGFSAPTTIDNSISDRIVLSMHGWRTQNHPLKTFFRRTIPTFFWFPQPAKSNWRRPLLNYCAISFQNIQVEKSRGSLTCSFFGRLLEPQHFHWRGRKKQTHYIIDDYSSPQLFIINRYCFCFFGPEKSHNSLLISNFQLRP